MAAEVHFTNRIEYQMNSDKNSSYKGVWRTEHGVCWIIISVKLPMCQGSINAKRRHLRVANEEMSFVNLCLLCLKAVSHSEVIGLEW